MLRNTTIRMSKGCLPDPDSLPWPPYGSIFRETEVPASRGSGALKSTQVWRRMNTRSAARLLLTGVVTSSGPMDPAAGTVLKHVLSARATLLATSE